MRKIFARRNIVKLEGKVLELTNPVAKSTMGGHHITLLTLKNSASGICQRTVNCITVKSKNLSTLGGGGRRRF